MKNTNQCKEGLLYHSFSTVLFQCFTTTNLCDCSNNGFLSDGTQWTIDSQLFKAEAPVVKRYRLKSFHMRLEIINGKGEVENSLEGEVMVRAALFFGKTVLISYNIIVPHEHEKRFCKTERAFTTDHLIALGAIVQKVENWTFKDGEALIDGTHKRISITGLSLDSNGNYIEEGNLSTNCFLDLQMRYRRYFNNCKDDSCMADLNYTLIDIWENVSHEGQNFVFKEMCEEEVIEHIEVYHRSELVGLMSLYPYEWPYRCEESYTNICGDNIAIDTDDLVLANQNVALIFGTYGLRGDEAPLNWQEHLKQRELFYVSWPEYQVLLEMVLLKKQTINYVLNESVKNSKRALQASSYAHIIEQNAKNNIELTHTLMQLDSIRYLRYISHKHMFVKTSERLRVEEDEEQLNKYLELLDKSLNDTNNAHELQQSHRTQNILWFISIASLFGVLMANDHIPLLRLFKREELSIFLATALIFITSVGIALIVLFLVKEIIKKGSVRLPKVFRKIF